MNKFISFLFVSFFALTVVFSQQNKNGKYDKSGSYHIKFKVDGAENNSKIQLAFHLGPKKLLQDTAIVENGYFEFKGAEPLKKGLYLVVVKDHGYFEVVINEDQYFSIHTDISNFVQKMEVSDHEENAAFYNFLNETSENGRKIKEGSDTYEKDSCSKYVDDKECLSSECQACKKIREDVIQLNKENEDARKRYIQSNPTFITSKMFNLLEEVEVPDFEGLSDDELQTKRFSYYKEHFFDLTDFNEDGLIRTPTFENKVNKYLEKLVVPSCDSSKAAVDYLLAKAKSQDMFSYLLRHVTQKFQKSKVMCMDCMNLHLYSEYFLKDSRVDWLSEEQKKSVQEEVYKLTHNQCGDVVYPFIMSDTNDVVYQIVPSALSKPEYKTVEGEYIILYFWSATCGHCKKATPKLEAMYKRLKDQYDLEVFGVCIDKERGPFDDFSKKHQLTFINTLDNKGGDQSYRTAYNVFSTPTIYLLNHNKEIIAKKVDIATLEKIITGKDSPIDVDHSH